MSKILQKIKQNKGITTADIAVSIVIITIFVGIITTVFYNFYLSTTYKNRNAIATNCLIDTIEKAKQVPYDEISQSSMNLLIESLVENGTIPKGYTVNTTLQKYNETQGNTDKEDIIKILNTKVEYIVGKKQEKIEISTLLVK